MKLQICRITQNFRPDIDGLSRHVLTLSTHQASKGYGVYLYQPFMDNCNKNGINIKLVKTGKLGEYVGYKLYTVIFCIVAGWKILLHNRRIKFDLIHCHGDAIEAFCFGLLGKILSIPIVLTVHGGLNRGRFYSATAPLLFTFVDRFIPISNPVRVDLERVHVPPEKIRVISTGINYAEFAELAKQSKECLRQKLGISKTSVVVAAVGRLYLVKGFEYLIDAAAKFSDEKSPVFYIIGDGPERASLLRKTDGLSNIVLAGQKKHTEVLEYLSCADIFVMSSVDLRGQSEAIPTVLIEALAIGLPVVTTDTGEGKYLIKNGVNGFVVHQRDPEALYKALLKAIELIKNPIIENDISVTNKKLAAERDWSVLVDKLDKVYLELI